MDIDIIKLSTASALSRIQAHPFVRNASEGGGNLQQIKRWLYCAGRESRSFPAVIEGILAWHESKIVRSVLKENLEDEHGNGNPAEAHFQHYLRLIESLGFSVDEFLGYPEKVGIKVALQTAAHVGSCGDEDEAVGYLLINEAMTPAIYSAVEQWLSKHRPSLQTEFFSLHISTDEHHVAMLYSAIKSMDESSILGIVDGIGLGERAMALLLDEAYGRFEFPVDT